MPECFICSVDGKHVTAIAIPERDNLRVCQGHYDELGIGLAIVDGDVLDAANPESALFRQLNLVGWTARYLIDMVTPDLDAIDTLTLDDAKEVIFELLAELVQRPAIRARLDGEVA